MKDKKDFDLEIKARDENKLEEQHVVHLICHSESDGLSRLWNKELAKLTKWCRYEYGLVMAQAQRNLMVTPLGSGLCIRVRV